MTKRCWLLFVLALSGCATNFDAKAQANALGVDKYGPKQTRPTTSKASVERPPLAREPFALVKRLPDEDILSVGAMTGVQLPIDAHIEQGRESGSLNGKSYTHKSLSVRLPGSHERFDREAGDIIVAALHPPPDLAVVFRYDVSFGIASYQALVVRAKPLATTADLANAEVIPWGKVTINLDSNEPPEETKLVAVRITFTDEAVKRLESDSASGVAFLLDGRVVRKDESLGKLNRDNTVRLVFEWPDLKEARATAEKLVAIVSANNAQK